MVIASNSATSRTKVRCIVLAPYRSEMARVREAISAAAKETRTHLIAVEEVSPIDFPDRIYSELLRADFVIAVLSHSSPNVFYELGLAHAIGKPVFTLVDTESPFPHIMGSPTEAIPYTNSDAGLTRLKSILRRRIYEFRRNPHRFIATQKFLTRPSIFPPIDLERLAPREFENLCFELLAQMGFRRIDWGKQLSEIDVVALLPKKDPDGFEYQELWLVSAGGRVAPRMLLDLASRNPDHLLSRLRHSGALRGSRMSSALDLPVTLLLMLRDYPSSDLFHDEFRWIEQQTAERRTPYTLRLRVWDRQQIVSLIQQHPQLVQKYFSDEGRSPSGVRKSYEQLYLENTALTEQHQATITALKEERDKRVRAERDAVWKDVAFTAAHKLGNPVFALETNLQGLKRKLKDAPRRVCDILKEMDLSLEKAKLIIDQFKSLTRAQEITPKPTELVDIFRACSKVAAENGVVVEIVSDEKELFALVDPARFTECLDELFANSLHWFDNTDKRIQIELAIATKSDLPTALREDEEYVLVRFSDNGAGIPVEKKEKIFAPFYTTYAHGAGLGLSLVQRVIESHGGAIREVGEPKQGSTFEIFLPRAKSSTNED